MLSRLKKSLGNLWRAIQGYFQSLERVSELPSTLEKTKIGNSESGNPIYCYKVGSGNLKVALVFGIHGNEVGTAKLAFKFIRYAQNQITNFKSLTIFVVPVLNVDGYFEAQKSPDYLNGGRIGRFNVNKVDLNRNFDTKSFKKESMWSFGKNYNENAVVFCGNGGCSELETKAITGLITEEKISVVYSFHNAGQDVMPGSTELSKELACVFSEKSGYKIISNEEWLRLKQTGTFKEWCDEKGVSFLEIEGKTRWASDWNNQKDAILSSLAFLKD